MNTGAFPPRRIPWRIAACRTPILGTLALRGFNLFLEAAFWMAVESPNKLSPLIKAGFRAPYHSWRERIGIERFVKDIPMSSFHPTFRDLEVLEGHLPDLTRLPVALIWGMKDWCFDEACLQRFEQLIPTAEVTRIEGGGHWVLEDEAEAVLAAMRNFFQSHPILPASVRSLDPTVPTGRLG